MKVLYLSYNGLAEPLGRTQVIPYVEGLSRRGHSFVVISFEKALGPAHLEGSAVAEVLPASTRWLPLRYHKNPPVVASALDIFIGAARGSVVADFDVIHARGTVAAAMAAAIAAIRSRPWIYDVRGLLAQEYVDAGHWSAGSLVARCTWATERRLMARASGLVFLTHRILDVATAEALIPKGSLSTVVPCMVDTTRFCFRPQRRAAVRAQLGIPEAPLLVYSGSLGSWYLVAEMLEFFRVARQVIPDLRFLGLTPQPQILDREAAQRGLVEYVLAKSVSPDEVPDYLSAADAGIAFVAPAPSKRASSPTKLAEYLACGLPVVLNTGVGDVDRLRGEPSWLLVDEFDSSAYERVAERLRHELADSGHRDRARQLAERCFSLEEAVESYDRLYSDVLSRA